MPESSVGDKVAGLSGSYTRGVREFAPLAAVQQSAGGFLADLRGERVTVKQNAVAAPIARLH